MVRRATSPDGLRWTARRLVVPTGFRPLTGADMLHAATPRRTFVEGMDRSVPDAVGAWAGPLPLGFLFLLVTLPLVPFALVLRWARRLPWTVEARAHPWGRRYPPAVLTYAVVGGEESRAAIEELAAALARGEGAPVLSSGEKIRQPTSSHGVPTGGHGAKF